MKTPKRVCQALMTAAALAAALPATAQMTEPRTSWYFGADVGRAKAKNFCTKFGAAATSCDDSDTSWGLFAGYQFNRNLALEAGYRNLGRSSTDTPSEIAAELWEADVVGILPLGLISVYGKVGLFRHEAKGSGVFTGITEHKGSATIAAGLQYDVDRRFGVRGEWQHYPRIGGGNFGATYDVDVFRLGGLYRF